MHEPMLCLLRDWIRQTVLRAGGNRVGKHARCLVQHVHVLTALLLLLLPGAGGQSPLKSHEERLALRVDTLRKQARLMESHNAQLQQQVAQLSKDNRGLQVGGRCCVLY